MTGRVIEALADIAPAAPALGGVADRHPMAAGAILTCGQ
jgi:hypothetical protein